MLVRTPNMQLRCGGVAEVVAFATGSIHRWHGDGKLNKQGWFVRLKRLTWADCFCG